MLAAVRGQLPTVRALVARGKADPAATDCLGRTAADLAELEGHTNIVNWLRRCAVLPPLHRACDLRAGERDIAELLRGGADPFLRSAAGETPLQICRLADAALGALPARKETTDVMADAVLPWHPKRHGLFPRSFRPTVVAVLLVQQRLERLAQQQGAGAAQAVGQRL